MSRARRTATLLAVSALCLAGVLAGPAVAVGGDSSEGIAGAPTPATDSTDVPNAGNVQNLRDESRSQGCFGAGGSSFTIGSSDDTHIWVRLHLGPLTDSGTAFGGELVGTAQDAATVEVAAGAEYVGDGVGALVADPLEAFVVITGFEFRLPVFDDLGSAGLEDDQTPTVDTTAENGSSDDVVLDGPFDTLEC